MDTSKRNFPKYCIQIAAYSVANMFCAGAIVQTFLLFIGFTESQVYTYTSLVQLSQVVVMVLMIFLAGRIRRGRLLSAISNLFMIFPITVFAFGAFNTEILSETYVIIVFLSCIIAYGGVGLYAVLSYCLPYDLIDMADYGKLTGISGALAGVATFLVSTLHTALVSTLDYLGTMICFLVFAALSAILSAIMFFSMKEIPKAAEKTETVGLSDIIAVFKNRDTYYLLIPNFTRGLAFGVFNVIAVMAVSVGIADTAGASALNLVMQLSSFAASVVFSLFYKKLTVEKMLIFATVGVALTLPFSLSFGLVGFLIVMLLSFFFRFIVDSAIPTALVKIIPESQIGAYSSIRMLIFTASQALAAIMVIPLAGAVGYKGLLILAVIMQLICGIGHYLVAKKHKIM